MAVMKVGLGPWRRAARNVCDRSERVRTEMLTHVTSSDVPNCEQYALPFVVACSVLVRRTKVAESDRTVNGRNDVGQLDIGRISGEHVPATDASLGFHDSRTFEREQDLLEVRLGQCGSFGNIPDRGRSGFVSVERERKQSPTGIISPRRHSHAVIVGAEL